MDDEHILAFIEAIDGTDFDAIHVFALNAIIRDDIGHLRAVLPTLRRSKQTRRGRGCAGSIVLTLFCRLLQGWLRQGIVAVGRCEKAILQPFSDEADKQEERSGIRSLPMCSAGCGIVMLYVNA